MQVEQTADNQLKLNIPNDISFDTGRADIKPHLQPILDQFAQGLGSQPGTANSRLTSQAPGASSAWALAAARAMLSGRWNRYTIW